MKVFTSEQMHRIEEKCVLGGISYLRLMENAGSACAKAIKEKYGLSGEPKDVAVVCGKGNNAGDGFVIARKLCELGCKVTVILACGEPSTSQAMDNYKRLGGMPVNMVDYRTNAKSAFHTLERTDIIVDAVFGIGLTRSVDNALAVLFKVMNNVPAQKVSVDIPSGLQSDTGELCGACVKADFTTAVCVTKPCHVLQPSKGMCGEVQTVSIGITQKEIEGVEDYAFCCPDFLEIKENFPMRNPVSNKGDYGKVLSLCGSRNMPGAAVLAAKGAVRSGVGLVTAAFPKSAYPAITSKLTCPTFLPCSENELGTFSAYAAAQIAESMQNVNAVLIGCGIGHNADTARMVAEVIRNARVPIIIDADGINIISANINVLKASGVPIIVTPHPGEMSRLTGKTIQQIQANRIQTAREFAHEHALTVVLKGANTVIADAEEREVSVNPNGNAGLAKGGSGDLLAGIIASFVAQGMRPYKAAQCGVYVHGMAGDIAAQKYSMRAMTPLDVADCLPLTLSKFEE